MNTFLGLPVWVWQMRCRHRREPMNKPRRTRAERLAYMREWNRKRREEAA